MLISVHIPKTAGGSFGRMLRLACPGRVHFDFGDPHRFVDLEPPELPTRLWRLYHTMLGMARRRQWRNRPAPGTTCIHGHFQATKYRPAYPDARLAVWLRDPVERLVSHYRYWLRQPDFGHSACRRLHQQALSLEQFAALPSMRDLQARYLDGVTLEAFWFVGVQERFESQSQDFFRRMGVPVPPQFQAHVNPAKPIALEYGLDDALRARLLDLNPQDHALYQSALKRQD